MLNTITVGQTCTCGQQYWGEGSNFFEAKRDATAKCVTCIDNSPDAHPLFTDDEIYQSAQRILRALKNPERREVIAL